MKNTATQTKQEIIEKICNLKHFNNQLSECSNFLYVENDKTFIGICIDKISLIEEREIVFRLQNDCFILTIWKQVKHIHISIL